MPDHDTQTLNSGIPCSSFPSVPRVAVLLCAHIHQSGSLSHWLTNAIPEVEVYVIPELCRRLEEISKVLQTSEAVRLVVGWCSAGFEVGEVQRQIRKVGWDALGVEMVNLRGAHQQGEKAKVLLAAAVARARAFAGSNPEHAKLYLSAHVSRRSLLKLSLPEYRAAPSITETLCAADLGCKACVDVCPQSALEWSNGRIHYDKNRCEPCGLCVTTCPRGAIQNPALTPSQLEAQISTLLDPAIGDIQPRGIVFTCQHTPESEVTWQEGWMPVKLLCVGMAPVSWLLAPLLMGASAVGVLPCPEGCPPGQEESLAGKIAFCQAFLQSIGAAPEMVRLSPLLDFPPTGEGKRVPVESPFAHTATATVLTTLAQEYTVSPTLSLKHAFSPLGIIEVRPDKCTGCGRCALSCPTGALNFKENKDKVSLLFHPSLCVACGQCLPTCPEPGAIALNKKTDLESIRQGERVVYQEEMVRCIRCGAPIAPQKMLQRIEALLGSEFAATMPTLTHYCMDCRSTAALF